MYFLVKIDAFLGNKKIITKEIEHHFLNCKIFEMLVKKCHSIPY